MKIKHKAKLLNQYENLYNRKLAADNEASEHGISFLWNKKLETVYQSE